MRVRLAITEARATDAVLDILTTETPVLLGAETHGPVEPRRGLIEAASIEGEITDAQTGQLLAQGIDRRIDRGPLPADLTWADVDRFFDSGPNGSAPGSSARGGVSSPRGTRWCDHVTLCFSCPRSSCSDAASSGCDPPTIRTRTGAGCAPMPGYQPIRRRLPDQRVQDRYLDRRSCEPAVDTELRRQGDGLPSPGGSRTSC